MSKQCSNLDKSSDYPILALSFFIRLVFLCTPAPSVGGLSVMSANCSSKTGAGGGGSAFSLLPIPP